MANPNHDELGRFSSGSKGRAMSAAKLVIEGGGPVGVSPRDMSVLKSVSKIIRKKGFTDRMLLRAGFGGPTPGERDYAKSRLKKAVRIQSKIRERIEING